MFDKINQHPTLMQLKTKYPSLNTLVIIFAIIMVWRGVWGLLDTFLFPGWPVISYIVSILLGALLLYLDNFSLDDLK